MTVIPTAPNRPMLSNSRGASSSGIVLPIRAAGVQLARDDHRQHLAVPARLHAVAAADLQLPADHPMHRDPGQIIVADKQPDLHVASAFSQAEDGVGARRRRCRGHRATRPPRRPSRPGSRRGRRRFSRASIVTSAPSFFANPSTFASISTAITRAPRAWAIMMAESPTPPQPWTATHCPADTWPCATTARNEVPNRHPRLAAVTKSISSGRRTRFTSAYRIATYWANEPHPVKPGWNWRSQT